MTQSQQLTTDETGDATNGRRQGIRQHAHLQLHAGGRRRGVPFDIDIDASTGQLITKAPLDEETEEHRTR